MRNLYSLPHLGFLGILTAIATVPALAQSTAKHAPHATVQLIAESLNIEPGQSLKAGLHVKLEPGWHVYWKNPGDAGLPIRLTWKLPAGFSVDSMQWPTPERISSPPLMNYGYEGEVVFPFLLQVPKQNESGMSAIAAKAKWLVCKDICLPEEADLTLDLNWPKAGGTTTQPALKTNAHASALLALSQDRLPLSQAPWQVEASTTAEWVKVTLTIPENLSLPDSLWFFPYQSDWMDHAAAEPLTRQHQTLTLTLKRMDAQGTLPQRLQGVIAASGPITKVGPQQSFELDIAMPVSAESTLLTQPLTALHRVPVTTAAAPDFSLASLILKLLLAFAGGLILNLMPCVLPVLSLKIFDFVQRAGHARLKVFAHGLTFTAGVLVSFWLLAGLLLILRQGGENLGWGYQLQSPSFLVVLCALFFFFSLNLFGVFEMGYLFTRIGQRSKHKPSGHLGSFFAGVTATVVATPCTAPFMGTAMGFAFTQSASVALLTFTFVGLGMASPYLLLAGFPHWMRLLPKPGEWMEHLKQFMGFPLLATAIWLAWILGRQAGLNSLIALLSVLLLGGLSAWILGKWAALHRGLSVRVMAIILALTVFVPAFVLVLLFVQQQPNAQQLPGSINHVRPIAKEDVVWLPYDKTHIDRLVNAGQPVFIDFTADWCLSCKVNEKLALDNSLVKAAFHDLGITTFKGDWTRSDAAITSALAELGRQSVPLYVLYTGKSPREYRLLPELLTANTVLNALLEVAKPSLSHDLPAPMDTTVKPLPAGIL
jgi:thiol:disulfide interchange protein